ncbi:hypothetical protein C3374_22165 [Pantoea sp. PSNIH4]|nr:hypothetical protein C3380_19465 [Pantoea sp. PSNIH5]POU60030.1 hypothetical protein C3374_22165 [Pantoea sp. PSNIH4]POY65988.1 hypothetical protein C3402_20370 [Pantoea sp. PSNIH3]
MSVKRLEIDHKGLPFLDDKGVYVFYEDYAALQEKVAQRDAQIAKLERDEMQLIAERDHAEDALADMYQAATGKRPEWSNWFSFADAVEEVESQNSELRAQIAALTAENVDLKRSIKAVATLNNRLWKWTSCMSYNASYVGEPEGMVKGHIREMEKILDASKDKTPATDAAANALRAEGAEAVAAYHKERIDALSDVHRRGANDHKVAYMAAMDVAHQLREGK